MTVSHSHSEKVLVFLKKEKKKKLKAYCNFMKPEAVREEGLDFKVKFLCYAPDLLLCAHLLFLYIYTYKYRFMRAPTHNTKT